jgi:signal peptidase I
MKRSSVKASIYIAGFVIFLLAFAYFELTYTRRVENTSMLPTLEPGDLVVIQGTSMADLRLGDIIVYDPPCSSTGVSVIHRVIAFQGGGVVTKGDNNGYTDIAGGLASGPVTPDCIEGKVDFVVPYVELLASLPDGANYILAALIFIGIILYELSGRSPDKDGKEVEKQAPGGKPLPGPGNGRLLRLSV